MLHDTQFVVNGEPHFWRENYLLSDLLADLGLQNKRVAVELNGEIVPRSQHPNTLLAAHDQVEIVHAIGGG